MMARAFRSLLFILPFALNACSTSKPAAGRPQGPVEEAGEMPASDPDKDHRARVMALFMDATRARLAGDLPRAIELFEATLEQDPKNAAAMYELAKLYHAAQNIDAALQWARKAQATDRGNIWYRFLLADLSLQDGKMDEAIAVYRGILQQWPDRYEVYFDLANALAHDGQVAEARGVYRDLEQRFGPSEELVMNEFDMLAGAGQMEEARKLLEDALSRDPGHAEFRGMLAGVYDQLGMHAEALAQYQRLLEQEPDNNMMRIALAEHYYGTGEVDKAFEQLRLAFADPDLDLDAKMQLLLSFYEMTRAEGDGTGEQADLLGRAYELIDILKQAHPASGKPNAIHGDFLLRDGKLSEARDQFREALKHEQDRFPIWQQLVTLDLQLNDHQALHEDAVAASELFPTLPFFHLYNGLALSNLKRHDEAIEALIAGRDLVVDDDAMLAQFWSSLGDAYNEAGDHAKSDDAFGRAIELDPENPNTLNNYAYYLSVRNDHLEKAEAMSRRSNALSPGQPSYLDTYAWVLYRMDRFAEAKEWILKAMDAGGSAEGVIVEHYGDILYKLGDAAGAVEQWKRAQQLGGAGAEIDRKVSEGRLPE